MSIWRAYADPSILARLEQLPQYRQATKEADEYWCKCVKRNLRDVIYCDDGNKIKFPSLLQTPLALCGVASLVITSLMTMKVFA